MTNISNNFGKFIKVEFFRLIDTLEKESKIKVYTLLDFPADIDESSNYIYNLLKN